MQNITTIIAVFEEDGSAVVIGANATEARVLVRVRQLGEPGAAIFARVVESLLAHRDLRRALILVGADATSKARALSLPTGTPIVRVPPWSVLTRHLRNAERDQPGERHPIPPRV